MTTPVAAKCMSLHVMCGDGTGSCELCDPTPHSLPHGPFVSRPDVPALTDGGGALERLTKSMWAKAAVCNAIAAQVGCGGVMWKNWEQQANDTRTVLAQASAYKERVEALEKALSVHDALVAECRIDGSRPQRDTSKPCDRCGATEREGCGVKSSASYTFIKTSRALLNGADR